MQIRNVTIHNFRSIAQETLNLGDYITLIGPNNCGKSNVISALLFFYDQLTLKDTDFFCCPECKTFDTYVEVEFFELSEELHNSLPEQYKLPEKRFKVRRQFTKGEKPIYKGFTFKNGHEELYDTDFFGAKGVGKGKLGDVIYIAALKDVAEELKTTGSATMAKLLKEIVGPAILESEEYKAFSDSVLNLSEKLRGEPVEDLTKCDYKTIAGIECFLNNELKTWNCAVKLNLEPLDPAKLAQQTAALSIGEKGQVYLPVESKGQGLQRSLEVALVKLWAEVSRRKDKEKLQEEKKKLFHPEFTLLLIEEPEAFQHPQKQYNFYEDLREIASGGNQQVIATTHSPYFLTPHADDLSTIIKILKKGNKSYAKFLSREFLERIASEEEAKKFRYHLWLNPERNIMFFSDIVLLVEGQTEKVLFNWILQNVEGFTQSQRQNSFVMDCGGKFQMDKFMRLCKELEIPHLVIHDIDDEKKEIHKKANQNIQDAKNAYTKEIFLVDPDVEKSLGVKMPERGSEKPLAILEFLAEEANKTNPFLNEVSQFLLKYV